MNPARPSLFKKKPIDQARLLRRRPTDVEQKLWHALRNAQLVLRFRRQHPIGPYIADFACVPAKLVVELDGGQHADSERDKVRDQFMRAHGWRILRFWNNQVNENMTGVLTEIAGLLDSSPHPGPLPHAGEGEAQKPLLLRAGEDKASAVIPSPACGRGLG